MKNWQSLSPAQRRFIIGLLYKQLKTVHSESGLASEDEAYEAVHVAIDTLSEATTFKVSSSKE